MTYEVFIMVKTKEEAMELRDKLYISDVLTTKEKKNLGFNEINRI